MRAASPVQTLSPVPVAAAARPTVAQDVSAEPLGDDASTAAAAEPTPEQASASASTDALLLARLNLEAQTQAQEEVFQQAEDRFKKAVQSGDLTQMAAELAGHPWLLNARLAYKACALYLAAEAGQTHVLTFLVQQRGIDLHGGDVKGRQALHAAVKGGHTGAVELLLSQSGVDVNAPTPSGATAFSVAIEQGRTDLAELLLQHGAGFNPTNLSGESAFHAACSNAKGDVAVIAWFIRQQALRDPDGEGLSAMINQADVQGDTPLMQALDARRTDVVDLLLAQTCLQAGKANRNGRTALHAAIFHRLSQSALALLKRGDIQNVDTPLPNGATPLFLALQNGDVVVAKRLKELGADVNVHLKDGRSLLHVFCEHPREDVALWVLANGPEKQMLLARDGKGRTPLMLAAMTNKCEVTRQLLEQPDIDPNAVDGDGWTPLHLAVLKGHAQAVALLLAHPRTLASPRKPPVDTTPLHSALVAQRLDIAQMLLDHGADINAALGGSGQGQTPLHMACGRGDLRTVQWLVSAKTSQGVVCPVDLNLPDAQGVTPLQLAVRQGQVGVAAALLRSRQIDVRCVDAHGHNLLHMLPLIENEGAALEMAGELRIHHSQAFASMLDQPNAWGTLPVSLAAQRGRSQALVDVLRPSTSARPLPRTGTGTAEPRGWVLVGHGLDGPGPNMLAEFGRRGGYSMQCRGDGAPLTWKGLQALDLRRGDFAIVHCHAIWNQDLQRVMLEFGPDESVPLVDVACWLYEKGVSRALFLGCQIGMAVEPLLARLKHDPMLSRVADRAGEGEDVVFSVVGDDGYTTTGQNLEAGQLFLEDRISELRDHREGRALRTRSVQPLSTVGGDIARGDVTLANRAALTVKDLDDGLDPSQVQAIVRSLLWFCIERDQVEDVLEILAVYPECVYAPIGVGAERRALHVACDLGRLDVVKVLLEQGADVHHLDKEGVSALHRASIFNHVAVVERLLDAGANIHQPISATAKSLTPLHLACQNGHASLVSLLLSRGASTTATTTAGQTALQLAQAAGHQDIVALLQAHLNSTAHRGDRLDSVALRPPEAEQPH